MQKVLRALSLLIVLLLTFMPEGHAKDLLPKIISKAKKSVVSIKTNSIYAAYELVGESGGTGFVIDKERGIIATNRHVIAPASVSTYEVTFNEGIKKEAFLLYYNQWVDIAFLKVNPADIPYGVQAIQFANAFPKSDEAVFIIGKNSGEDFSLQTGSISNLYDESESLCSQVFRISLNVHGGASGSPVLNYKGQVIGIINSSNRRTTAWAIPVGYLADTYNNFLKKGLTPSEKSIGAFLKYYPIDYAIKFTNFSNDAAIKYKIKYPNSFNRILRVEHILPGSPATGLLKVGDILWKVNGIEVGPSLYHAQKEIALHDKVEIEVFRDKEFKVFEVPTYDAEHNKIERILYLGGGIFYEADDMIRFLAGVDTKSLMLTNITDGSSFSKIIKLGQYKDINPNSPALFITPISVGNYNINNLNELTMAVPNILKNDNKYFTLRYKEYSLKLTKLGLISFNNNTMIEDIEYNLLDNRPKVFWFDKNKLQWKSIVLIK